MKRHLLLLLLPLLSAHLNAQEVYNFVLENATRVVNTPTSGFTQTKIAQFKRTALLYLRKKAFETQEQVTEQFLNEQAYYLSEFLALFFGEILKDNHLPDEQRRHKILLFMEASLSNPLFNDPDLETARSYIEEGTELTPFSLDTDWIKAYDAMKAQLQ